MDKKRVDKKLSNRLNIKFPSFQYLQLFKLVNKILPTIIRDFPRGNGRNRIDSFRATRYDNSYVDIKRIQDVCTGYGYGILAHWLCIRGLPIWDHLLTSDLNHPLLPIGQHRPLSMRRTRLFAGYYELRNIIISSTCFLGILNFEQALSRCKISLR